MDEALALLRGRGKIPRFRLIFTNSEAWTLTTALGPQSLDVRFRG